MTQDYNKKSVRQFQCRDYLWDIFEQMGGELECSVDYLMNEAMRQYARSRSQAKGGASGGAARARRPTGANIQAPAAPTAPSGPKAAPSAPPVPSPPSAAPPPLPSAPSVPAATGGMPPLFVVFNGQKFPVAKEEFVIGRGSKTADLPIKDGNISRRHAAVVLQEGTFFMKDLGSTNGVEFNGERIATKKIEEGDIYQICDYELKFTYQ